MQRLFLRARVLSTVAAGVVMGLTVLSGPAAAQTALVAPGVFDPGVRGGVAAAGGPLPGLNAIETAFFNAAQGVFEEVDSVSGAITGENGKGLGPRFNLNSCAGCHAFPAVGGTSPATNPQIAAEVFLSVDAVKAHLRLLFERFGLSDLPQNEKRGKLVSTALSSGVLAPHDF